mmetsp:Transcript_11147/g.29671  ORF Transcript_11147/g.29671 Transcript_11147/m.29671 type:complete len:606 (+) Transcript_11147:109-1926(+)|eukprot:CAMPEP_0117551180 /NCGR_PEP_ID=MMETSP0784-20121206/49062_1 /TAXON_ID=39447 /ORGANISM="" /LENGTH=605 /DNA_ID=CAMNT_0005348219 /DNA_START=34 /DNA_END=1851 /DNA_ORIENTATION=+
MVLQQMRALRAELMFFLVAHVMLLELPKASPVGAMDMDVAMEIEAAFGAFDANGDGRLSGDELAHGISSSAEQIVVQPRMGTEQYSFGRAQCDDPVFDAVSFSECLVAEAREPVVGVPNITFPATLSAAMGWYISLCHDSRKWLSGECRDRCSACRSEDWNKRQPQKAKKWPQAPRVEGAVDILITSDWHIEPWYLYAEHRTEVRCPGPWGKRVCRFKDYNMTNMFECRHDEDSAKPQICLLDGDKDPPLEFGQSHLASAAALSTELLFFVGDGQAHDFPPFPKKKNDDAGGEAVSNLLNGMLTSVVRQFGAGNVVWTPGNNDGPHGMIFRKPDPESKAWARALLQHGIVTDALNITYSGSGTSKGLPLSPTELFETTGFYCKRLTRIATSAYAIVLNTNLGGSNPVQEVALKETLAWVRAKHGSASIVYLLGHHPVVMDRGVDVVPRQYRGMVKGVLAGHTHLSKSTSSKLFTQVPAVTQAAREGHGEFYIARGVSASSPEIFVDRHEDLVSYAGFAGGMANPGLWTAPDAFKREVRNTAMSAFGVVGVASWAWPCVFLVVVVSVSLGAFFAARGGRRILSPSLDGLSKDDESRSRRSPLLASV